MSATEQSTEQHWSPDEHLVADLRHCLAHAPRQSAEDRFEAWAWRSLLDEDGAAVLTRHARPAHFTSSGLVLSPDGARTLLVLHGRIGLWVQPGGHLEPGDVSVAAAAAREVREETGHEGTALPVPVVLSRHEAPCRPDNDWHLDLQFLVVAEPGRPLVSDESRDVRWFDVDDLPSGLAPGVDVNLQRARLALAGLTAADLARIEHP